MGMFVVAVWCALVQACHGFSSVQLLHTHRPILRGIPAPRALSAFTASVAAPNREADVRLIAPAKVNLFLRMIRKRPDGYHDLASLFQAISLHDTLEFWDVGGEGGATFECHSETPGGALVPTDDTNLVVRALNLFNTRSGIGRSIHCRMRKVTPVQAGLGGGSSDAATALFAANRLAGFPVEERVLQEWGAELGCDVSFFLSKGTAYCTGRGDELSSLPALPATSLYVVKPQFGLSTPAVYGALDLSLASSEDPQALLDQFKSDVATATFVNDLQQPAMSLRPQLAQLIDSLKQLGFPAVMLSGSGTAVFCIGQPHSTASPDWQAEIEGKFEATVYPAEFVNRPNDEKLWYNE